MRRTFAFLALLAALATEAHADMRVLATASSESYQSLTFGLSAFCQAAGFPFALTEINARATDYLLVPNLSGVDTQNPMALLWVMSDRTNEQQRSLAAVAVLPTADHGALARQSLEGVYREHAWDDERQLWVYSSPASPSPSPVVYAAVRQGHVVVSASAAAAGWVAARPLPVQATGGTAIAGQVRVTAQPAALAALLKAMREQRPTGQSEAVLDNLERLLSDVRRLELDAETTAEGVTLRLFLGPESGSRLAGLIRSMHAPGGFFWQATPAESSVAVAGGGRGLWEIVRAYRPATTNASNARQDPLATLRDCLTGDTAAYVTRSSSTGSIYYASLFGVTNPATAWQRACQAPQSLMPFLPSFRITTNGFRTVKGTAVLDLGFAESLTPETKPGSNPADFSAFMLRDGGLSLAVTGSVLAVTFGPSNAMERVLSRLSVPPDADPMPARVRRLLTALPQDPCSLLLLQPVALVRQVAESLPGMTPERLAALPQPGDGMAAAAVREADGTLRLSIRMSANEVERAQRALTEGRAALQDIFMQMALQQLMQRGPALDDPRRKPSPPREP